jgi:hypothetical protein
MASKNSKTTLSTSPPEPKHAGGAPKRNRNAVKSGHYARKLQLQSVSFSQLHANSAGGIQLLERRNELVEHCGGEPHISAITRRVIERTCFTEYLIDHLDFYVIQLGPHIVNKRRRAVLPILLERNRMIDTLLKLYDKLGYSPTARPIPSLQEYLASKDQDV